MNKGFGLNGILIAVLIILAVGTGGVYVVKNTDLITKDTDDTVFVEENQEDEVVAKDKFDDGHGAPKEIVIVVTSPKEGNALEIGKTYDINWENYSGADKLNVTLEILDVNGIPISTEIITTEASQSTYKWKVPSRLSNNKYRIQIYPSGSRELVGRSGIFSIVEINKLTCEQVGGEWEIWNNILPAIPECNLPTSDVGKKCTDSDQCESFCQAEEGTEIGSQVTGKCYGLEMARCMQEVKGGKAQATWCY